MPRERKEGETFTLFMHPALLGRRRRCYEPRPPLRGGTNSEELVPIRGGMLVPAPPAWTKLECFGVVTAG